MIKYIGQNKDQNLMRILSFNIGLLFIFNVLMPTAVFAKDSKSINLNLLSVGSFISNSSKYSPTVVQGLSIYPDNPLKFDFIVDSGDDNLVGDAFNIESTKLIKYFLASLTVPEDETWVNLSPYEKDRIIPDKLGTTEMGKDMLAQDYLLKQLTSSLMYPENELGQKFWNNIYEKTFEKYGVSNIDTDTFNKVWIVPSKAVVYESENGAFVGETYLKVMLESDYIAMNASKINKENIKNDVLVKQKDGVNADLLEMTMEIVRDVIVPELEKEVNQGKNFANLRQIFNSMILATWYKKRLKESLLGKVYINQNKVRGVDLSDKTVKQRIYDQYIESFKNGVYNYIKEDYDVQSQQIIPRKYFSGGVTNGVISENTLDIRSIDSLKEKDLAMLVANNTDKKKVTFELYDVGEKAVNISDRSSLKETIERLRKTTGLTNEDVFNLFRSISENNNISLDDIDNEVQEKLLEIVFFQIKRQGIDTIYESRILDALKNHLIKIEGNNQKALFVMDYLGLHLYQAGSQNKESLQFFEAAVSLFNRTKKEVDTGVSTSSLDVFYNNDTKEELSVIKEGSTFLHRTKYFIATINVLIANEIKARNPIMASKLLDEALNYYEEIMQIVPASENALINKINGLLSNVYMEQISLSIIQATRTDKLRTRVTSFLDRFDSKDIVYHLIKTYLDIAVVYEELRNADDYQLGKMNSSKLQKTFLYSKLGKAKLESFKGMNATLLFREAVRNSEYSDSLFKGFDFIISHFEKESSKNKSKKDNDAVQYVLDSTTISIIFGNYDQAYENLIFLAKNHKNELLADQYINARIIENIEIDKKEIKVLFEKLFELNLKSKTAISEYIVRHFVGQKRVINVLREIFEQQDEKNKDLLLLDTIFSLGESVEPEFWQFSRANLLKNSSKAIRPILKRMVSSRDPDLFNEVLAAVSTNKFTDGVKKEVKDQILEVIKTRTTSSFAFLTDLKFGYVDLNNNLEFALKDLLGTEISDALSLEAWSDKQIDDYFRQGIILSDGLVFKVDKKLREGIFQIAETFVFDDVNKSDLSLLFRMLKVNGGIDSFIVDVSGISEDDEKIKNVEISKLEQVLAELVDTKFLAQHVRIGTGSSADNKNNKDAALITSEDKQNVGGIDFNSEFLDMQIKRDERNIPLPINSQSFEGMNIEGFIPVIINVETIASPFFSGIK